MKNNAKWITTKEFANQKAIDVFHKEQEKISVEPSALRNIHTHFVKDFAASKGGSFCVVISADDYYKLYVNGHFVCQGPAAAYPSRYHYNEADITPYIVNGENRIAVHVYYQGLLNRVWNSADNRMGLYVCVLQNEETLLTSDESWLTETASEYSGDTTGYDTMFLENIDFSRKNEKWKSVGETNGFTHAFAVAAPDWILREKPVPCVSVYPVKPQKITETENGYLYDFGCELCGQLAFTAHGKRGEKLYIHYGEELNEDGSVRSNLRCNCHYVEELTLSGKDDDVEFFDYAAFRYAAVIGNKAAFNPNEVYAVARHHAFREQCFLESNIPHLSDIWSICRNALKIGVQEGYLDCPSREKGQYLGDFTVSGLSHLYLTGDTEQYKKALFDFADTSFISRGIMAVAPGALMQEIADFSLQYPLQVKAYFEYSGDTDTLRALYPTVEGILSYFHGYERPDGLMQNVWEKWNLVDWPANLRDGYCVDTTPGKRDIPAHNVLNAFYIGAMECENALRHELGLEPKHDIPKYKEAFYRAFYDEKTGLFCDDEQKSHAALHSNVLPVCFDMVRPSDADKIGDFIMQKRLACGVHFSYFVLKALAKLGRSDDELSLILNVSEHSWVNMLREGATTCFEAWGKEQKWNTSLCHPWASAPIPTLIEDILKIPRSEFRKTCAENLPITRRFGDRYITLTFSEH